MSIVNSSKVIIKCKITKMCTSWNNSRYTDDSNKWSNTCAMFISLMEIPLIMCKIIFIFTIIRIISPPVQRETIIYFPKTEPIKHLDFVGSDVFCELHSFLARFSPILSLHTICWVYFDYKMSVSALWYSTCQLKSISLLFSN